MARDNRQWVEGIFVKRLNRFSALVQVLGEAGDGGQTQSCSQEVLVHVANTARLKELLLVGAPIRLTVESGEKRKTPYTLRQVAYGDTWVSIDSNRPNQLVKDWLEAGLWSPRGSQPLGVGSVRSEVTWGDSRFDLRLEPEAHLIEVKGVTLLKEGWGMFPDAPTSRGTKHVTALMHYVQAGGSASVVFVCQRGDIQRFRPYSDNDPDFAKALREAHAAGVGIYVLRCRFEGEAEVYDGEVPWQLD